MASFRNGRYNGRFSVQVMVNRRPFTECRAEDGFLWVGIPMGLEYELLITTPPGEFKVIVSVDGLDVTDGKRKPIISCGGYIMRTKGALAAPKEDGSGCFLDDGKLRRIIRGHRLDDNSIATFRTGRSAESYATVVAGEPDNVGVIGVAFIAGFVSEHEPEPDFITRGPSPDSYRGGASKGGSSLERSAPPVTMRGGGGGGEYRTRSLGGGAVSYGIPASRGLESLESASSADAEPGTMGTQFGRKLKDEVRRVKFSAQETLGSVEIHYDNAPVLAARGLAFPAELDPADRFEFRTGCALPPGWTG